MSSRKHHSKDPEPSDDIKIVPEEASETRHFGKDEAGLREKLAATEKERMEYLEGWQRAKADLINYKKEMEAKRTDLAKFANENLIQDLLSVLDSFDMAFMNKTAWESVPEGWRKGVEYIHAQFLDVLRNNALEQIYPMDETFDPVRHEPVETVPTDDKSKDHKVIEVLQRGYMLHGKIIRPARVKVAEFKEHE